MAVAKVPVQANCGQAGYRIAAALACEVTVRPNGFARDVSVRSGRYGVDRRTGWAKLDGGHDDLIGKVRMLVPHWIRPKSLPRPPKTANEWSGAVTLGLDPESQLTPVPCTRFCCAGTARSRAPRGRELMGGNTRER